MDKLVKSGFGVLICKEDSVENLWSYSNDIFGRKIFEANSSSELASRAGCVVACIAEILSAYTGVYVVSSFINDNKSNFLTGSGEINWSGIKKTKKKLALFQVPADFFTAEYFRVFLRLHQKMLCFQESQNSEQRVFVFLLDL